MISYQIYNFNKDLGSIIVKYKNGEQVVATYNVDIPLTDAGLFIAGEKLNSYLLAMFPQHVIDRQNKLAAGIPNVAEIEALSLPSEEVSTAIQEQSKQEMANNKMWMELEEEKRVAKLLVKFGVLTEDPTAIPNTTL